MRIGAEPEGWLEAMALAAGMVPTPLLDTLVAAGLCRTIMVASRVGVFEVLSEEPLEADAIAQRCRTHPAATQKLLHALVGSGYLEPAEGGRFALGAVARRWLLKDSDKSLHDHNELMFLAWRWIEHYDHYVRTGEPLSLHDSLAKEEWGMYQRGMRSLAGLSSREVAWRTPMPSHATDMLDVGGSHGHYSVAICRRHPRLRATVLDLPDAIAHAAPILAREEMGDRVVHEAGDALHHEFGEERWDFILVSSLVHHFDDPTNRDLVARLARSLRPRGVLALQDVARPTRIGESGGTGALGDLYFGVLSLSGTWSYEEMAHWQREAGLEPLAPIRMLSAPGLGQQCARKG